MGKLIIDGNSVYEIDEECLRSRPVPEGCKVLEAIQQMEKRKQGGSTEKTMWPQAVNIL
ncbi:MAG: hypothetical protein NC355_06475 [Blautia sp.]|nr:hypothetical protein [Blautia sp.]